LAYQTEAHIFAKHILETKPDAKIGVLYQNDGFGKDYLIGLKYGLGADHAGMVIKEVSYETSEPTVDSQIATLEGSGADVFLIAATPKFAAQAIRKADVRLRLRQGFGCLEEVIDDPCFEVGVGDFGGALFADHEHPSLSGVLK
jgi:ABC-type branched-subunit amino acid transport system substrate-binding protein